MRADGRGTRLLLPSAPVPQPEVGADRCFFQCAFVTEEAVEPCGGLAEPLREVGVRAIEPAAGPVFLVATRDLHEPGAHYLAGCRMLLEPVRNVRRVFVCGRFRRRLCGRRGARRGFDDRLVERGDFLRGRRLVCTRFGERSGRNKQQDRACGAAVKEESRLRRGAPRRYCACTFPIRHRFLGKPRSKHSRSDIHRPATRSTKLSVTATA
jgi:hypothetical protein